MFGLNLPPNKRPLDQQPWKTEGPNDRVIVACNGEAIGMMDTPLLAKRIVKDHNHAVRQEELMIARELSEM